MMIRGNRMRPPCEIGLKLRSVFYMQRGREGEKGAHAGSKEKGEGTSVCRR
jgi:hypothetical protein